METIGSRVPRTAQLKSIREQNTDFARLQMKKQQTERHRAKSNPQPPDETEKVLHLLRPMILRPSIRSRGIPWKNSRLNQSGNRQNFPTATPMIGRLAWKMSWKIQQLLPTTVALRSWDTL
jgi:hypothetical protein